MSENGTFTFLDEDGAVKLSGTTQHISGNDYLAVPYKKWNQKPFILELIKEDENQISLTE